MPMSTNNEDHPQVNRREAQRAIKVQRAIDVSMAPPWLPSAGDYVTGTVVGYRSQAHVQYGDSWIVMLDTGDRFIAVHMFHTMLQEGFRRLAPKVGDEVTVIYGGHRLKRGIDPSKAQEGDYYHHYLVFSGPVSDGLVDSPPWLT